MTTARNTLIAVALTLVMAPAASAAGPDYSNRDLTRSHWENQTLVGASFKHTDLYGSTFLRVNLDHADLSWGNRTQGSWTDNTMRGADLSMSDWWGSDLTGTVMTGVKFHNTKLDNTDLTNVNMKGSTGSVTFYNAHFCRTTMPSGTVRNDHC